MSPGRDPAIARVQVTVPLERRQQRTGWATTMPGEAPTADATAPVDSAHLQKLARSGGLSVLGAGVSAVAGVGLVAVLTHGLNRDLAGTVFASTALFLIAAAVVQLGAEVGLVRYLPSQLATGRLQDVRPTLRTAVVPVAVLAVVVGAGAALAAPVVAPLVVGQEYADTVTTQIRVLAAFLPLAALYNVVLAATRGCRTMRPTVLVESLGRHLVQLVVVGAAALGGASAAVVVLAWSVPYALGLAVAAWWLLRLLRRARPAAQPAEVVPEPEADGPALASSADPATFWRFTAPRAAANIAQTLLKRSDIVLVAALRSPGEAALYTAATRFVVFGQLGVQALQQALAPQLSALFARGERRAAQEVYETATAWSLVFAWPVDEVDTEDILHDVLLGAHEGVAALTPSPPADDRRTGQDRGTSFVAIPVPRPRPPRCEAARIPEHWEVSKDDRRLLPSRRRADRGRALCRSARQGRPFARHNAVVGLYWVPALLAGCLRSP